MDEFLGVKLLFHVGVYGLLGQHQVRPSPLGVLALEHGPPASMAANRIHEGVIRDDERGLLRSQQIGREIVYGAEPDPIKELENRLFLFMIFQALHVYDLAEALECGAITACIVQGGVLGVFICLESPARPDGVEWGDLLFEGG